MKWLKNFFRHKYLIHVTYKSGTEKAFWAYEFSVHNGNWKWVSVYQDNQPIIMGVDEVESVYQGEVRWFGRSIWTWIILGLVLCYYIYSAF